MRVATIAAARGVGQVGGFSLRKEDIKKPSLKISFRDEKKKRQRSPLSATDVLSEGEIIVQEFVRT